MCRCHRMMWLEQWARAKNTSTWSAEGHGPGLHHGLPRVVAHGPQRVLGCGGGLLVVGALATATTIAVTPTTVAIRTGVRVLPPPLLLLADREEDEDEPSLAPVGAKVESPSVVARA